MHLLLADDDETTRYVVKRMLARLADFHVHEAETGREAIRLLDAVPVDAVLTDYQMPDVDGVEVLRHAMERQAHARRILMSGTLRETVLQTVGAKACIHLAFEKPFELDDWTRILRAALQPQETA